MSLCISCHSIPFRNLARGESPPSWKKDSWTDDNGIPWGSDSEIWTCNRRQTTLPRLRKSALSCTLCRMLIHRLESRPTYIRVAQEVDLDVAPVWLLLAETVYSGVKLDLILDKEMPSPSGYLEVTAVEFRNRFGMWREISS